MNQSNWIFVMDSQTRFIYYFIFKLWCIDLFIDESVLAPALAIMIIVMRCEVCWSGDTGHSLPWYHCHLPFRSSTPCSLLTTTPWTNALARVTLELQRNMSNINMKGWGLRECSQCSTCEVVDCFYLLCILSGQWTCTIW